MGRSTCCTMITHLPPQQVLNSGTPWQLGILEILLFYIIGCAQECGCCCFSQRAVLVVIGSGFPMPS